MAALAEADQSLAALAHPLRAVTIRPRAAVSDSPAVSAVRPAHLEVSEALAEADQHPAASDSPAASVHLLVGTTPLQAVASVHPAGSAVLLMLPAGSEVQEEVVLLHLVDSVHPRLTTTATHLRVVVSVVQGEVVQHPVVSDSPAALAVLVPVLAGAGQLLVVLDNPVDSVLRQREATTHRLQTEGLGSRPTLGSAGVHHRLVALATLPIPLAASVVPRTRLAALVALDEADRVGSAVRPAHLEVSEALAEADQHPAASDSPAASVHLLVGTTPLQAVASVHPAGSAVLLMLPAGSEVQEEVVLLHLVDSVHPRLTTTATHLRVVVSVVQGEVVQHPVVSDSPAALAVLVPVLAGAGQLLVVLDNPVDSVLRQREATTHRLQTEGLDSRPTLGSAGVHRRLVGSGSRPTPGSVEAHRRPAALAAHRTRLAASGALQTLQAALAALDEADRVGSAVRPTRPVASGHPEASEAPLTRPAGSAGRGEVRPAASGKEASSRWAGLRWAATLASSRWAAAREATRRRPPAVETAAAEAAAEAAAARVSTRLPSSALAVSASRR